jgi:preprotein translocase subunit SecE
MFTKIKNSVVGLRTFMSEVKGEMQKCAWPTRPELVESTMVVIVSVLIFAAFVGLSDQVLMGLLGLIVR